MYLPNLEMVKRRGWQNHHVPRSGSRGQRLQAVRRPCLHAEISALALVPPPQQHHWFLQAGLRHPTGASAPAHLETSDSLASSSSRASATRRGQLRRQWLTRPGTNSSWSAFVRVKHWRQTRGPRPLTPPLRRAARIRAAAGLCRNDASSRRPTPTRA